MCREIRQRGLTLLELVVSLLVLTVLTTVAIRSVSGIQEQARFERSKRLLEEFRSALLGNGDWSSGVFGYAFDLATFPENLRQLLDRCSEPGSLGNCAPPWDAALAAVSYRLTAAATPTSMALGYGWRGPYLAVLASADDPEALRDGFGGAEGTFANVTNYGFGYAFDSVSLVITSFGADHQPGPFGQCGQDADYEEDCALLLKRDKEYRFTPSNVTVTLTPPSGGGTQNVFLALFARDSAGGHLAAAFSTVSRPVTENGQYQSLSFSFNPSSSLTAGPVLVGLFRCQSYTPCPPTDLAAFQGGSRIVYPDNHPLLYRQIRPQSTGFEIAW